MPPTPTPPSGAPSPASGGTVSFVHHPGDPWSADVRVVVGTQVRITLLPARGYRWTAVESVDPAIGAVTGHVEPDGTAVATVQTVRSGTVTLRATTSFTGDRFGPATWLWQLTVHIVTS